jgi:hypothetical protein
MSIQDFHILFKSKYVMTEEYEYKGVIYTRNEMSRLLIDMGSANEAACRMITTNFMLALYLSLDTVDYT